MVGVEARRGWYKTERRKEIVLADVPDGEMLDGKPLRSTLIAAGVPQRPEFGSPINTLKDKQRPKQAEFQPPTLPWAGSDSSLVSYGLMGVGGLLLAGALWERRQQGVGRLFGG
ncbi:hypothetical protein SAMN02745121_01175 [Nannocystis exedens]|uniref:Uncharacterized protein n=1 Tax=Nannocystis exedens TaxID=54 RepID=A0A1I1UDZ0_9BACT|nr:hypothetical protein NAEX_04709 [Nannocystis exedens]SFD68969.1 hypothetical protein SAMN02745121_01175 [Nannocystis exedens]